MSLTQLQRKPGIIAEIVFRGEEVLLTRNGKEFAKIVPISKKEQYEIAESEKYPGCYNIYDSATGDMVNYFTENDNKNLQRAQEWVKLKEKKTPA